MNKPVVNQSNLKVFNLLDRKLKLFKKSNSDGYRTMDNTNGRINLMRLAEIRLSQAGILHLIGCLDLRDIHLDGGNNFLYNISQNNIFEDDNSKGSIIQ